MYDGGNFSRLGIVHGFSFEFAEMRQSLQRMQGRVPDGRNIVLFFLLRH